MINLENKPFYLNLNQINQVYKVFNEMTEDDKIGQIFCPIGNPCSDDDLEAFIDKYKPGAMMFRALESK